MSYENFLIIVFIFISSMLWILGGFKWKWARRYVLPLALGALIYFNFNVNLIHLLLFVVTAMAVNSLGYGDENPWWKWDFKNKPLKQPKWVTGLCLSLPSIVFGLNIWQIVLPIVFLVTFKLSVKNNEAFPWKMCEGLVGLVYGVSIITSVI